MASRQPINQYCYGVPGFQSILFPALIESIQYCYGFQTIYCFNNILFPNPGLLAVRGLALTVLAIHPPRRIYHPSIDLSIDIRPGAAALPNGIHPPTQSLARSLTHSFAHSYTHPPNRLQLPAGRWRIPSTPGLPSCSSIRRRPRTHPLVYYQFNHFLAHSHLIIT